MNQTNISLEALNAIAEFQKIEITSAKIYASFAKRQKDEHNRKVLEQIAADEAQHAQIWKKYTNKEVKPCKLKVIFFRFLEMILGYTFVIKLLENGEYDGVANMEKLKKRNPRNCHNYQRRRKARA